MAGTVNLWMITDTKGISRETPVLNKMSSDLPLALVPDLRDAVEQQASQERGAKDAELIGSLLTDRDHQLLAFLKAKGASAKVQGLAEQYLASDREQRLPDKSISRHLEFSDSGYALQRKAKGRRLPLESGLGSFTWTAAGAASTVDARERIQSEERKVR